MQFPINIGLRHSRFLFLLLMLFHSIAATCVLVLPWPWFVQCAVMVLLAASARQAIRPTIIRGLCVHNSERLTCRFADGSTHELSLLPGSTVFSHLIVLRLKLGEKNQAINLTLMPDQMSAKEFRTLALWLRWHSARNVPAAKLL